MTVIDELNPEERKRKLRDLRARRRRAALLSRKLSEHEAIAQERRELWRSLRDDGVDVAVLAHDSNVTPMAVRKALR